MTRKERFLKGVEILKKANEFQIGHGRSLMYHFKENEFLCCIIIQDDYMYKEELKQMDYDCIVPMNNKTIMIRF